jgi:hypothetical protein
MTSSPITESTRFPSNNPGRASLRLALALALAGLTSALGCTGTTFSLPTDGGTEKTRIEGDAALPDGEAADAGDATVGGVKITGDLAFGAVGCGEAAAPRTLHVENLGARSFTLSATLTGGATSPYAFTIKSATVPPQGVGEIEVTPKPIPSTSVVPGTFSDTLTIRTDVDDGAYLIPITETAQGVVLSFDTQAIPFGEVPVSSAQSSTFHVVNAGNVAAQLQLVLGMPSDSSFSVSQAAATVSGGDSLTAAVTFSPTSTGPQSSSVSIVPVAGTALCAPLPKPLSLTGIGENGGLAVSSNALTFGPTNCGTTAAPQALKLTNSGNAPLTWSASFANASPSPYGLSPATTGSLASGASVDLTVTAGPIPAASSVQADFYADTLTFTTDVIGDQPHPVALSQTASGAILAFNPTSVSFGDVPVNTTGIARFQITNSGNSTAKVTVSPSGTGFSDAPSGAVTAPKDAETDFTGSFAPGNSTATSHGTFAVTTTDPLCAPLPSALAATGTGTNGVVAFSPGSLAFGNQSATGFTACGTRAPPQQVTFTNSGNQSYTITAVLQAGASSPYAIAVSPTSGLVAANGGSATITVTPNAIPATSAVPGSYGDSLSVTTTAAGDTAPHVIPLSQSAYGAVLTGAPASIAFPATPVDGQSTVPVGITNSGNASAVLVWNAISNSVFTFDQNVTAPPGGVTTSPVAYFLPTMASTYAGTATFAVTPATIMCQPIPSASVGLSGTGTNGSIVSVTPAQVNFNMVSCGTSGGADVVTIKNDSTGSLTWTASLPTSAAFTLSMPTSGTLASGASATVTVTSTVIPVNASTTTASNGFGSQLTVTTSAMNDTPHVIPILETASGAILSFNPTTLTLPAAQRGMPVAYEVVNTGNVPASVSLALTNPGPATLTLDAPVSGMVSSGTPLQGGVTEDAASLPSSNATVSLTPAAGTVLCQPAPAPMNVTAN